MPDSSAVHAFENGLDDCSEDESADRRSAKCSWKSWYVCKNADLQEGFE